MLHFLLSAIALPAFASGPFVSDDLLPVTPEGWRYERIELPLEFAPDLDYRGFEELRFAPGMFTEGAPDFWSYAFALRIEGYELSEVREATAFLKSYYGGLCEAVASSRQIEFERDAIQIDIDDRGTHFACRLQMIDPFVTGKPLDLGLDLTIHHGPLSTELLGIASPADRDAEVWRELAAIRNAWLAERPGLAHLHGLRLAIDNEALTALADDARLSALFPAQSKQLFGHGTAGLALLGRQTFLEFVPLEENRLTSTLVLCVERSPGLAGFEKQFHQETAPTSSSQRRLNQTRWYSDLTWQGDSAVFGLELREYASQFLGSWNPPEGTNSTGNTRRQVLARYRNSQTSVKLNAFLPEIRRVELIVTQQEARTLAATLQRFGYSSIEGAEAVSWRGPGASFKVMTAAAARGVVAFEVEGAKAAATGEFMVGPWKISRQGETARFQRVD